MLTCFNIKKNIIFQILYIIVGRDGQYFKYMYFKYVFEIQNTILYFNTFEKNKMYFVFKYI